MEHLAMKSSISTCGYVSTRQMEGDDYTCDKQFYDPTHEGGLCDIHEGSWNSVPTYVPDWETTLICRDNGTCDECYYCYHIPDQLNGTSSAYTGLS